MELNRIAKDLGVTNKRVLDMILEGRLIIESYTVYEDVEGKNEVIEKIRVANGLKTKSSALHHFKNGSYDPETFIVKKMKCGPKPTPA